MVRGSLHDLEVRGGALHAIVVDVEARIQAEPRVEHERADECARPVAGTFQGSGQRRLRAVETERPVVVYPVRDRVEPCHDRGVRGQRHRHVRVRGVEAQSFLRQPIERGCQTERAAVGANVIGAERVDRHQQDVVATQGA
jgi:hypothetical protein